MNSSGQTPSSRAQSFRSTPRPSVNGTNHTTPSLSRRSSPLRRLQLPLPASSPKRRRRNRATWSVKSRRGSRMQRLIHCWKRSLVLVGCMRPFQAGLDRSGGQMGIFLKVKSWRYVSLLLIHVSTGRLMRLPQFYIRKLRAGKHK